MFPRLAVRAAAAWSGAAVDWPAARPALAAHLERLAAAGIEYRPLDAPHPWQAGGTGRRQATTSLTMDQVARVMQEQVATAEPLTAADVGATLARRRPGPG